MGLKTELVELQQRNRDNGWRIKEIPWTESKRLEVIAPRTPLSKFLLIYGLLGFLIGLVLATQFLIWGLGLAISGLCSLFLTNVAMARKSYGKFEAVEANCIDQEIRHFSFSRRAETYGFDEVDTWAIRLLCEYEAQGKRVQVTPIIPNTIAFNTEGAAQSYLNTRIKSGKCRLWVDPNNALHSSFHDKPKFQMRGNT